jgi:hypothetical protein
MASPDYYNDSFEVDAAGEEQIELPLGIKLDLDNDDELLLQEELNQLDQNTDYQDDYDENNYILPGISNYNNNEEINEDLDRMPRRRNKKKTKGPINQNYNNNESEEIQRLHSIIKNQTVKIRSLTNDKKGLEKVTRYQSRQLMEYDKIKKNSEGNIMTTEGQINVLLERVRRLNDKWEDSRNKIKILENKNEMLNRELGKFNTNKKFLMNYVSGKSNQVEESIILDDYDGAYDNIPVKKTSKGIIPQTNQNASDTSVKASKISIKNSSNPIESSSVSVGRKQKNGGIQSKDSKSLLNKQRSIDDVVSGIGEVSSILFSDFDRLDEYPVTVAKMQKGMRIQRLRFTNEINILKKELSKLQHENGILQQELKSRENESRLQLIQVKELRQVCEDLAEGNRRLLVASEVYAEPKPVINMRFQQPHPPISRQASNNSIRRNSNSNPKSAVIIDNPEIYLNVEESNISPNDAFTFFITEEGNE